MHQKVESATLGAPLPNIGEQEARFSRAFVPEVFLRPDLELRQAQLSGVIASEIVPRLIFLHHGDCPAAVAHEPPSQVEIREFGALAMRAEIGAALDYFGKLRAKGHSLDTLFVHFLAPTARYLGELWDQDRCDFIDVALGVARLQQLLAMFGANDANPASDAHHRALLISTPGERHSLGLDMVAKFMRAAGWEVEIAAKVVAREAADWVRREWFGVVGLTLSVEGALGVVGQTIEAIRRASCNPEIGILVGGPAFAGNPELALRVGADAAAQDAPTAVILAKKLLLARSAARKAG